MGKVRLHYKVVTEDHEPLKYNNEPLQRPSSGQTYLLGQGLYHFRDGFIRPALLAGQRFKVILKLHDSVDSDLLGNTLLIFGLLGGLGSRARKGWGALAIRSLIHTDRQQKTTQLFVPYDVVSYKATLTKLLTNVPSSVPLFTAFSKHSRIEISAKADNPERLLNIIGDEMQLYRSYGRKVGGVHKVNSRVAEQNFKGDHDLIYFDFAHSKKTASQHPRRLIFCLITIFSPIRQRSMWRRKRSRAALLPYLFIHIVLLQAIVSAYRRC